MFKKITIIGVGLIGGSIGLAAKKKKLAKNIVGVCRREVSKKKALKIKAVKEATLDIKDGVKDADLVIVATPVGKIVGLAREALEHMKEGAIITDVGSTKKEIVNEIEKTCKRGVLFIGSHPMAGSEKGGPQNADKDLFKGRQSFVTKTENTDDGALLKVKRFWKRLGSEPIEVSLDEHDRIVAKISQMVHIAASSLVIASSDVLGYAASGFKDTTRIALADSGLWKDICMTNNHDIAKSLKQLIGVLKEFRKAILRKKTDKIEEMLKDAQRLRNELNNNG